MKKLFKFLIAVFLGFSLASCTSNESLKSVLVDKETLIMEVGQEVTLHASVNPTELTSETNITWTSEDTKVATVDLNGLVTAIGPGTSKITVIAKRGLVTRKDVCTVKVLETVIPVSGVVLDKVEGVLDVGEQITLTPTISPDDASIKDVKWESSNNEVVTVNNGLVTAVGKGEAIVTVTTLNGDKEASCSFVVNQPVTSILLDKYIATVNVGEEFDIEATVMPLDATNKDVVWSSSNNHVALVTDGHIKAIAPGVATIKVATLDGAKEAKCIVSVIQPVESVTLNKTSLDLIVNEEVTLEAEVLPSNATNKDLIWSTSDASIVSVNNGLIKALAPGEATITVKSLDGNKQASCIINVTQLVSGVSLDTKQATLEVGESLTLEATVLPLDATNKNVTWTSSDESVASVTNGEVEALQTGSVVITVTTVDGSYKDVCVITVIKSVESVSLNKSAHTMNINDSFLLEATVLPTNATNKDVIWTSNNEAVASVVNGVVTAKSSGNATITVTTVDGNYKASCVVTVTKPVESVSLNIKEKVVEVGEEFDLVATVLPTNASNKDVTWLSSNESVATVEDGHIKAILSGSAVITVKTVDGAHIDTCRVTVTKSVTGVVLNKDNVELKVGENEALIATISPSDATNKDVIWESSNESVASVDQGGIVTAKEKGSAVITVTTVDGSYEASCTVNVTKPVTGVSLSFSNKTLEVGDEFELIASVLPADASNKDVIWTSSDESVVSVTNGEVEALQTGSAVITVTTVDGSYKDVCVITVTKSVTGVTLNKDQISLKVGENEALIATVSPSDATNKDVIWESSNESVASVTNGIVVANSVGNAIISVTTVDGEFVDTCEVKVSRLVTGVTLNKTSTSLKIGQKETLIATVLPYDSTNKDVIWSSNNEEVALVNNGEITAVSAGNAIITVTTKDGGYSASCTVSVAKPVTGVSLDVEETTLGVGNELVLKATVLPVDATNKNVTWTSSDNTIASVEDGVVEALKEGTVIITVTTVDGEYSDSCVINVVLLPTSVEITNGEASSLNVNETLDLDATVLPTNATNKNVIWSTTNSNVATVDQNGVVSAIKAGVATIMVRTESGNKVDSYVVTVLQPVTDVKLDKTSIAILEGTTASLIATVLPLDASNKQLIWTSSNESIVSVNNGEITGLSKGEAVVTVTTVDGNHSATCNVKVVQERIPATGVTITQENNIDHIKVDETIKLDATYTPVDTTDIGSWYSSDESVATVDQTGLVTAHNEGSATIMISVGSVMNSYTIHVSKHTPTITLEDVETTYLDEYEVVATSSDCNETIIITYYNLLGEEIAKPSEAGSYVIKAKIVETYKYFEVEVEASLVINKRAINMENVEWSYEDPFTYDGSEKTVVLLHLPSEILDKQYTNNKATNTGTYTASVTLVYDEDNYFLENYDVVDLSWTINKASIDMVDVTWNYDNPFTYNNVDYEVKLVNVPDKVTVTYNGNKAKNAGEYDAVATLTYDEDNYVLINNNVQDLTWKINKAVVNKPSEDETVFTYDGTAKTYTLATNKNYTITGTLVKTNAGSNNIVISLNDKANYEWNDKTTDDITYVFVINKAKVEAPTANTGLVYDGTSQIGVEDGEYYSVSNGSATNAGEYDAVVTLDDVNNYEWEDGSITPLVITYTIAKKEVAEPSVVGTYTYNKEEQTVVLNGFDSLIMSISGNKATNAGTYNVVVTLDDNHTWKQGHDGKFTWTINKVQLVKPIEDDTVYTYNFEEQTYQLTENENYTISNATQTNAGEYTVKVVINDKINYEWEDGTTIDLIFDFEIKVLVVEVPEVVTGLVYDGTDKVGVASSIYYDVDGGVQSQAGLHPVSVTLKNSNLVWSNTAFDGQLLFEIEKAAYDMRAAKWDYVSEFTYDAKAKTVKVVGLPNGVSVESYVNNSNTNVGNYTSKVKLKYDSLNYYPVAIEDLSWSIVAREIEVTIHDQVATYGDAEKELTYTVTGSLATGHTDIDVFEVTRVAGNVVGEYEIGLTKLNDNYNITVVKATYTINPKVVAKPSANVNLVYDNKDLVGVTDKDYYTVTNGVAKDVDTYTATVSLDDKVNYIWDDATTADFDINYEIVAREIKVTFDNKESVYGEEKVALTYKVTGSLATGHSDADVFEVNEITATNAGSYVIDLTKLNDNYEITVVKGTYTIKQKSIEGITFNDKKVQYDGQQHSLMIDGSLPEGVNAVYTPTNTYTEKGVYEITVSFIDTTGNYIVPLTMDATLEIYVVVTGVTLDESTLELEVTDTFTLTATIVPENANNQNVTWSSDNPLVATVDQNGLVTAVAPGTATITVTTVDGNETATCEVKVNKLDNNITASDITVTYGEDYEVTFDAVNMEKATVKYFTVESGERGEEIGKPTNAGLYKAVISIPTNEVYKASKKEIDIIINKAQLTSPTISESIERVYSGEPIIITVDTSSLELAVTATVTYYLDAERTVLFDGVPEDYGKYYAKITFSSEDPSYGTNYEKLEDKERQVNIEKKAVFVTWSGTTEYVYDGTSKSPLACEITKNVIAGDDVSLDIEGEENPSLVGTYTYTISLVGEDKDNYRINENYITKTLTINKAPLELSFSSTSVIYDTKNHKLEVEIIDGKALNDDIELVVEGPEEARLVGTYTYTITLVGNDIDNYVWEDMEKTVVVNDPGQLVKIEEIDENFDFSAQYALAVEYDGKVYSISNQMNLTEDTIKTGTYVVHEEEILTFDPESEAWTISKDANNIYYICYGSKYLTGSTSKDLSYSTTKTGWVLAESKTKGQYLQSTNEASRGLLLNPNTNNGSPIIGNYAVSNINSYGVVKLYKLPSNEKVDLQINNNEGGAVKWTSTSGSLKGLYTGIDIVTLTMEANTDYSLKSVMYNESPVLEISSEGNTYTCIIPITEGGNIEVTFGLELQSHGVSVEGLTNATIKDVSDSDLAEEYEENSQVIFKVIANDGYYVASVQVENAEGETIDLDFDGNYYSFVMGSSDVIIIIKVLPTLKVELSEVTNGSALLTYENGSALASGAFVPGGTIVKIIATADRGYEVKDIKVNNISLGEGESQFEVTSNSLVTVVITQIEKSSIADVLEVISSFTGTMETDKEYIVEGEVKSISYYNTSHHSYTCIISDGTGEIQIYSGNAPENDKVYVGDTIRVLGFAGTFNDTKQIKQKDSVYPSILLINHCEQNIVGTVKDKNGSESSNAEILNLQSTAIGGTKVNFGVDYDKEKYSIIVKNGDTVLDADENGVYSFEVTESNEIVVIVTPISSGEEDPDETTVTTTVSISNYADAKNWTDSTKYTSINIGSDITVTATGGGNTGKYYVNGEQWRIYQNESPSVTVKAVAGKTIVSVKITYVSNNTGVLTFSNENIASGTVVSVNANSITFNVGNTGTATNGQVRITDIEVVYQTTGGENVDPTPETATLSFADKAQRTTFTTSQQVWEQNGIIVTNNKGSSTSNVADYSNPVRFYKSSELIIEAPGNITEIVFTASSSSYATALKNSIGSNATASGSTVTVTLDGSSDTFTIAKLTEQVRVKSIEVTYSE